MEGLAQTAARWLLAPPRPPSHGRAAEAAFLRLTDRSRERRPALGAPSYEIFENTGHLATQLIEAVVDRLRVRGRHDVVADVSSANEASRGLFRRAGFEEGISETFFTRRL